MFSYLVYIIKHDQLCTQNSPYGLWCVCITRYLKAKLLAFNPHRLCKSFQTVHRRHRFDSYYLSHVQEPLPVAGVSFATKPRVPRRECRLKVSGSATNTFTPSDLIALASSLPPVVQ